MRGFRRREVLALGAAGLPLLAGLSTSARGEASAAGKLFELSSRPANYESPLSAFLHRVTPIESFYVRNHFDMPTVDPARYRLVLGGLVDAPTSLSLAELEALPQREVEAVLQCAGNGRALFQPRMPGVQWRSGAMGNAVWRGPRLKDVLAVARPRAEGVVVELSGLEQPAMPSTPAFVRGIPIAKALHDDTIVALSMNGQPLPRVHGGPARLVVPGWVADDWTKWLGKVRLLDAEPKGFFFETAYRFPSPPGAPGEAMPPERMHPMSELNVKSVIATPARGAVVAPGPLEIVGVALSGGHGIRRVDISTDGKTWKAAELDKGSSPYGFALFRLRIDAKPGALTVRARATDETGAVQPAAPVWNPSGYLYNAIDTVTVEVRA